MRIENSLQETACINLTRYVFLKFFLKIKSFIFTNTFSKASKQQPFFLRRVLVTVQVEISNLQVSSSAGE